MTNDSDLDCAGGIADEGKLIHRAASRRKRRGYSEEGIASADCVHDRFGESRRVDNCLVPFIAYATILPMRDDNRRGLRI